MFFQIVYVVGLGLPLLILLFITSFHIPECSFLDLATKSRGKIYSGPVNDMLTISLNHTYSTHVLTIDPLMIYLDGFLHASEVDYLLRLGNPLFQPSRVVQQSGVHDNPLLSNSRTSESCFLPGDDAIVSSIKARSLSFMGFLPHSGFEALQLVRYKPTQKIKMHYDWFKEPKTDREGRKYNRLASFFLYLDVNCTAGETYFPSLPSPPLEQVEGDRFRTAKDGKGLAIVPKLGSGIFWINLKEDGLGDSRTLHAGIPVGNGSKIGMNIWVKRILNPVPERS